MKLRIASLSLLAVTLAAVPAVAQTVYSNGPINGNTDAWAINFGFVVSDTFNVTNNGSTVSGASFAMWLLPGDTLTSAELSITSNENGGTNYYTQVDTFTQSGCMANQLGYNVCQENTSFAGPTLNAGTYWLNLQNASVPSGDPVFWDENSGPSSASNNTVGTIPSESFTVLGSCGLPVLFRATAALLPPQPPFLSPAALCCSALGLLGLASLVRRKLF